MIHSVHIIDIITVLFILLFDKQEEEGEDTKTEYESDGESEWEPDPRAVDDPTSYRINTWESTVLGWYSLLSVEFYAKH